MIRLGFPHYNPSFKRGVTGGSAEQSDNRFCIPDESWGDPEARRQVASPVGEAVRGAVHTRCVPQRDVAWGGPKARRQVASPVGEAVRGAVRRRCVPQRNKTRYSWTRLGAGQAGLERPARFRKAPPACSLGPTSAPCSFNAFRRSDRQRCGTTHPRTSEGPEPNVLFAPPSANPLGFPRRDCGARSRPEVQRHALALMEAATRDAIEAAA